MRFWKVSVVRIGIQERAESPKCQMKMPNQQVFESLPPAWDSQAMTMRTKKNIDTLSIDDLYNNLSVFEQDIQKTSSSSLTSDNVAFLSQAKASSSKHTQATSPPPPSAQVVYSSYNTSSSKTTTTATPGLADEIAMTAHRRSKVFLQEYRHECPRVGWKNRHVGILNKRKVECSIANNTGILARECKFKRSNQLGRAELQVYNHTIKENAVKGKMGTAVKTSAGCVLEKSNTTSPIPMVDQPPLFQLTSTEAIIEHRGIFDSENVSRARQLTGTGPHLEDYQQLSKEGSELGHFNLFSISQICDKKLNVLFTEKEFPVLKNLEDQLDLLERLMLLVLKTKKGKLYAEVKKLQRSQGNKFFTKKSSAFAEAIRLDSLQKEEDGLKEQIHLDVLS
ncbi:hypothetical protein Tco_0266674 [Tanacetum coccineum]